jgi:hypothetical protein
MLYFLGEIFLNKDGGFERIITSRCHRGIVRYGGNLILMLLWDDGLWFVYKFCDLGEFE